MENFKDLLKNIIKLSIRGFGEFQENKMSVYSGYATLFIVTAMIPFIILIISIVNLIPGYSAEDAVDILLQFLPDLESVRGLAVSVMNDIRNQSGGLVTSAATVTTLWAASKGVMAIQKGLNQLDSEDKTDTDTEEEESIVAAAAKGRIYVKGILKRLFFTLMLIILIPALLVFEMLKDAIAGIIQSVVQRTEAGVLHSTLEKIDSFFDISSLLVFLLAFLVIVVTFAYLPAKRRTLKSQFPGAFLATLCWFVFTDLFSVFINLFYHSSYLYGVLAAIFLLLMWLRYVVMILFAGSVLNHILEEDRKTAPIQDPDCEPARL